MKVHPDKQLATAQNRSARCYELWDFEKPSVLFISQAQGSSRDVLLEMSDRGSPRDGQHHGRSPQEPSQRYLRGARTVRLGNLVKHLACNFPGPEWEPGNKGNSIALAIIHGVIPLAVREAVAVLHGDDGHNPARSLDMLLRDIGQRDEANLAFVPQLSQRFHRGLKRDDGIRNMQLINVDAVQAQSL